MITLSDNGIISVSIDNNSGSATIVNLQSKVIILKDIKFDGTFLNYESIQETHEKFGHGRGFRIYYDSSINTIMLYDNLEFAIITSTKLNNSDVSINPSRIPMFNAATYYKDSDDKIKAFGTQGLTDVDDNKGSYTYLALVEPGTRNGIVSGFLTCKSGYGLLFSESLNCKIKIRGVIDYGNYRLDPGCCKDMEMFAVGYFEDSRIGLEKLADNMAIINEVKLNRQLTGYCTWYSDKNGAAGTEESTKEIAEFCKGKLLDYGFDFIQIDDGWQAGVSQNFPKKDFTTHDKKGPYPSGMKAIADHIKNNGFIPGLWYVPFSRDTMNDNQDESWFVKSKKGGFHTVWWCGTALDMSNPGARKHLYDITDNICNNWGYKYLKLDGINSGFVTNNLYTKNTAYIEDDWSDLAVFQDPYMTNIENFHIGMKVIRKAAGPDTFINACNAGNHTKIIGAAVGHFDSVRICGDGGMATGARYGTQRYFLHGRVYYNDPDIIYVREPKNAARLSASWAGISGQMTIDSDWLPGLDEENINILRKVIPSHGLKPRPIDLFDTDDVCNAWLLTDRRGDNIRDVVGLFNFTSKPVKVSYTFDKIGICPANKYHAFDFWENRYIGIIRDRLDWEIPPVDTTIIALRKASDKPQILSTSRHVSQGMVDIIDEKWDNNAKTLYIKAKVVKNDDYEIRITNEDFVPVRVVSDGAQVSFTIDCAITRIKVQTDENKTVSILVHM